ncbi:mitogen-activated protein kinase kinase kinase 5 isoform X2 [Humulus lupulus]|uniref:mitogen-activated protein kinase kinase kinase 5 isoform X2 n=1 Tax=Humulus lupulus TaxID=3486 RepID=UPI002B405B16|nr:mitogen-activated protein kinase kinase kinase 5 isoform X2 [Humulus lupulus]
MRWLPNISFSSSSSSSSSLRASPTQPGPGPGPADSAHKTSAEGDRHVRGVWRFGSKMKISRQRKLRPLSDRGVVSGQPKWSDSQWGLHKCASGHDRLPARTASASALPQPLPLPEISPVCRRKEGLVVGSSSYRDFDCPLPSPKLNGNTKGVEDRDKDRADHVAGDGVLVSPKTQSKFFSQEMKNSANSDLSERRAAWKGRQNEKGLQNFRVEVPIRSAPTSPFSSPALSPQRPSFDMAKYYRAMIPKPNQVWSAPEMPFTDMMTGPPPAYYDGSPYSSPTNSPPGRSISQMCKSPNGSSSPLYQGRLSFDTSRRESIAPLEVHRLPLPPVAASPSPSHHVPQVTAKPEPVLMQSQWQKGKLIGRGTFGSVYVASNRETGALCAMKEVELFPDDPKSAECIKQLEQEIKVLSQLKHQNIVQYYGSETVDDRFYIYLEYVHPGSINKYVREHCGAITESVVRNFTRHILSGLAYLHSKKTIHRDIKGANLLVDSTGVVKLADFGMAKHLTGHVVELSMKGSPYWMAPELMHAVMQKDNNSDLAFAIDIWSLGCTIIEMLTGKPPWSEYEGAAAMFKVLKDSPPIPETLSSEGKDFLQCCFRRNPADRPTAALLLEHRFLKNSQQLDVSSCCIQAFSGINIADKTTHSPTTTEDKHSQSTYYLTPTQINGEKFASESSSFTQYCFSPVRLDTKLVVGILPS